MEDLLVQFGDAIKAERIESGVKLGGYLIRYSTKADPDITGEHFTPSTDFDIDLPAKATTYFHHGMDATVGKRKLGRAELSAREFGIWAETILQERDEYEKFIAELSLAGKLGWSSGSVAHLVEIEAGEIKRWPIAEASLTHTPAEPRNGVIPLKSLIPETTQAANGAAPLPVEENPVISKLEVSKMELTAEEIKAMVSDAARSAVEEYRKSEPATVKAGVSVVVDEADQPFKHAGEFFQAVKIAAVDPNREDVRLRSLKAPTGMGETVASDGGYLIPPAVAAGIQQNMFSTGAILSRVAMTNVSGNSMTWNLIDETSRASTRFGGVLGYWLAEAGTITASAPKFKQFELKLKKVAALCYATDELLADTAALQGWLTRSVPDELRFQTEGAMVYGDGVGKPLGIIAAPGTVSVTRVDASKVQAADVVAMYARRLGNGPFVWLINRDVTPQLFTLGSTYQSYFIAPGQWQSAPGGQLLGFPIVEVEYCSTLGTVGDIILADLSMYQAIQKGGIDSASSIHVKFTTAEQAFRFVYRVDGAPMLSSAITPHKGSNTQAPFVTLSTSS